MTTAEIAKEHEVSRQTIHTYRRTGIFPAPVEGQGSTRPRFREDEVIAFFEANPKQPRKKRRLPPEQQGEPMQQTADEPAAESAIKPDFLTDEQWGAFVADTMRGLAEGLREAGLPVEWVQELITPAVTAMLPRLVELAAGRE